MDVTPRAEHSLWLADEPATARLGARIADRLLRHGPGGVIGLSGPLGAGKTSLARGVLRALGVAGAVHSPTYTLLELYETQVARVVHLDLYRLSGAEELTDLGVDDYPPETWWWLVEWPERAGSMLPDTTLDVDLSRRGQGRLARLRGHGDDVAAITDDSLDQGFKEKHQITSNQC